jgi:fatty acid desaturase
MGKGGNGSMEEIIEKIPAKRLLELSKNGCGGGATTDYETSSLSTNSSVPVHAVSKTPFIVERKVQSYKLGRAEDKAIIPGSLRPVRSGSNKNAQDDDLLPPPLWIGIQGKYYNATKFATHHPGGDVIYEFHHQDATAQFVAYHSRAVLKRVTELYKVEGTYEYDADKPGGSALQGEWMKMNDQFEQDGLYDTPALFVAGRIAIVIGFTLGMCAFVLAYHQTHSYKPAFLLLGAICLAGLWQQSGFLMHDTMHNHLFHNREQDQKLGWIFGSVLFGVSSKWWRDEHNEHHLFTNTVVGGVGPSDPQMIEEVWIQDPALIPFFAKPFVGHILRFQQYYFIPLCVGVGPLGIRVDGLLHTSRLGELAGVALHFLWVAMLIRSFDALWEGVVFYMTANCFLGILSVQLLVSHYSRPWEEKEETKHPASWAARQIEAVLDISCPTWMDWFHGGLHLHSPHHLFPRMCRCHYRTIYKDIVSMCEKHEVELDNLTWTDAVRVTVKHLGEIGAQNKLIVLGEENDKQ